VIPSTAQPGAQRGADFTMYRPINPDAPVMSARGVI
jgi:hypothetical protein